MSLFKSYDVEFFRNTFITAQINRNTNETILVYDPEKKKIDRVFCSCCRGSYAKCSHAETLKGSVSEILEKFAFNIHAGFLNSTIYKALLPFIELEPLALELTKIELSASQILVSFPKQESNVIISGESSFLERLFLRLQGDKNSSRFGQILRAMDFALSDNEKFFLSLNRKTIGLSQETSIWYRIAYNCFIDFSNEEPKLDFKMKPDGNGATFSIVYENKLELHIPVSKKICSALPLKYSENLSLYKLNINQGTTTIKFKFEEQGETIHVITLLSTGNENIPFTFNNYNLYSQVYFNPDTNKFYLLDQDALQIIANDLLKVTTLHSDDVSSFIDKNYDVLTSSIHGIAHDTQLAHPLLNHIVDCEYVNQFSDIEITPLTLERSWCYLSINYKFGNSDISLNDLIKAKEEKRRVLFTKGYLVDLENEHIQNSILSNSSITKDGQIKVPKAWLLTLTTDNRYKINKKIQKNISSIIDSLVQPVSSLELQPLQNFQATLRNYQIQGLQWLLFITKNDFGGILADDMGLGKTLQILALISYKVEYDTVKKPFIVICPATVVYHWMKISSQFTPTLKTHLYYGQERNATQLTSYNLIVTSYGILRRDIDLLKEISFYGAIFDEAQFIKNNSTFASAAASMLNAISKIAVTGTPIENSIRDLKNLMDLVLPGFLGETEAFEKEFIKPIEEQNNSIKQHSLRQIISPFILRRTKEKVLSELPELIEDIRGCELSYQQVALYKEAIQSQSSVVQSLENESSPIPYMHIFSLINKLKQICDHPALISDDPLQYKSFSSGKWELCKELIEESLLSKQKIIIFTQYLGMVAIISHYLQEQTIGHVTLTGESKNRGTIVNKFNQDPDCKIFIGTLQAAGSGIDLVGGSVVIHYDRWWNAAKEDQATDRAHRLGQKSVVSVFKLVTLGTLEEKIAGIIQKKRQMSVDLITENPDSIFHNFSREDLKNLFSFNGSRSIDIDEK